MTTIDKNRQANISDGSTADYYLLPWAATELQDLISFRNMNAQIGEIFRAAYRYGLASHSDQMRDARKIQFYINAEIERLENQQANSNGHIKQHTISMMSHPEQNQHEKIKKVLPDSTQRG